MNRPADLTRKRRAMRRSIRFSNAQRKGRAMRGKTNVLMLFAVLALALVTTTGAAASPPTEASGTFTTTSATFNSMQTAGGNTIIDLSATVSYTGTFTGTSTVHGILIFHSGGTGAQFPPWRANFHDVETFTGTVNGVPGMVTFNLAGTGSMAPPAGSFRGTGVIVSGTGGLANLRGVLSEVGTVPAALPGPLGTYTGQIH
jgi:hypothetical protein